MKSFSYALSSNLLSLIITSIVIIVVPRFLGIEEYGYFQLYIFYSTYTALLHFGWIDGIYLRFGGAKYEDLDKDSFYSQFWMLLLLQVIFLVITFIFSTMIENDINRVFIFRMMIASSTIVIPKGFLQYILQATNRILEYSQLILIEKFSFGMMILVSVLIGLENFHVLVTIDVFSKFLALLLSIYHCKDLVFRPLKNFSFDFREAKVNIVTGINLLFAFISGSLIIGIVRFAIESYWNVETFGRISLTLNVSSLFMIFINSLSIIMFPVLRRVNPSKLRNVYNALRVLLLNLLLGLLISYFPMQWLLKLWLPKYTESLDFMLLLFPIMIFEGKINLLVNTYFKTLRKEKVILKINLLTVFTSLVLTITNVLIFRNLYFMVISITLLLCFRSTIAEIILSKYLELKISYSISKEILFVILFIAMGSILPSSTALILYIILFTINILMQKNNILSSLKYLKNF